MKRGDFSIKGEPLKRLRKKARQFLERSFDWIALIAITLVILCVLAILNL